MVGPRDRAWLVTPWRRGKTLPRFEPGEGLDRLLGHVAEVVLTSLPKRSLEAPSAQRATLDELRQITPETTKIGGLPMRPLPSEPDSQGWAMLGWNDQGELVDKHLGRDAVIVPREPLEIVSRGD